MKRLAVVGSTGSIGKQVLDIVARQPQSFIVEALVSYGNVELLAEQSKRYSCKNIGLIDKAKYSLAKQLMPDCNIVCGQEALSFSCRLPDVDTVVVSVVGMNGLDTVMAAIDSHKTIALANKECLVAGGEIVMNAAKEFGVDILPIDSEHSAIWQCLRVGRYNDLKRIILTASGGAYYNFDKGALKKITPEQAIKHPNWKMGKKISVDSATMMNKGLELIEARWLFGTKNVDYIIHPESLIHSMVEFCDGAIIAQMSVPDMRLPISLAISYPDRVPNVVEQFKFDRPLNFIQPNEEIFFGPKLAKCCIEQGGIMPCVLNAANEEAVQLFLDRKIRFDEITCAVRDALDDVRNILSPSIKDIYECYDYVRTKVRMKYCKE